MFKITEPLLGAAPSRYITWQACVRIIAVLAAAFTVYTLHDYLSETYYTDGSGSSSIIGGSGGRFSGVDYIDGDPEIIPYRIYQTWTLPVSQLVAPYAQWQQSWPKMNPSHRYELITDAAALSYVQAKFKHEPEIVETFKRIVDPILRADYIRYLILLADGGVYTDMDTVCVKPIEEWIPIQLKEKVRMVVGLEFDAMGADISGRTDFLFPIQFSQWTLMAAPGHPFLRSIVKIVTRNLRALGEGQEEIRARTQDEVLKTTGPKIFVTAMMDELSRQAGRKVTFDDLKSMQKELLFGNILVLPINAFTSGAPHSNASLFGQSDQQLIEHHFQGFNTWRTLHADA